MTIRNFTDLERQQAEQIEKLQAEVTGLRAFAREIMDDWPQYGGLDGFELGEIATKHGLLMETTQYKPCREEGCNCAEMVSEREWADGVICFRETALLKGEG
jgi:hypothetical protein